jgi:hypothetical protein
MSHAVGVDSQPLSLIIWKTALVINGFDWTFRNARAAVDADIWVDVEHLSVGVEAVGGAHGHAVRVATAVAILRNYEGQWFAYPLLAPLGSFRT